MSALTALPRAVARFQRAYPRVRLVITPGGSVEQLDAIRQGRCDIGFMPFKREVAPLESVVVACAPLVAVLPARHPLARHASLELAQLSQESFIFLKQQSELQIYGGISAVWRPQELPATAARFLEVLHAELELDAQRL